VQRDLLLTSLQCETTNISSFIRIKSLVRLLLPRLLFVLLLQREMPLQRSHVSETLEARSNLMAFQRPTTERNQKGYGYIDFYPLKMIDTQGFIKDNTLIIKAQVRVYDTTVR